MDEQRLQTTLNELLSEIGSPLESDGAGLDTFSHQTQERSGELKQTAANVQGSIDYLRLSVKYLLFDLEATRRENAHLREMLEEEPEA